MKPWGDLEAIGNLLLQSDNYYFVNRLRLSCWNVQAVGSGGLPLKNGKIFFLGTFSRYHSNGKSTGMPVDYTITQCQVPFLWGHETTRITSAIPTNHMRNTLAKPTSQSAIVHRPTVY